MGAEVEKKEMRGIETMTVQVPWKAILRFSIPLFIGSLFQQIYSMADAVIVGRLVGITELGTKSRSVPRLRPVAGCVRR